MRKSFTSTVNEEISGARNRIGKSSIDELKWLLNFAFEDIDGLSKRRLVDLGWELAAFSFDEEEGRITDVTKLEIVYVDLQTDSVGVPLEILRRYHAIIRKGLDDFFYGPGWEVTHPEIFERLKIGYPPFRFESVKQGFRNVSQRRLRYIFNLVKGEWERLWVCENPRCSRPFAMGKKGRGRYCSPRCNAYVRISLGRVMNRLTSGHGFSKLAPKQKFEKIRAVQAKWKQSMRKQPRLRRF